MKSFIKKLADILKMVFGYGIMITLFAGGLTAVGYVVALIVGGDLATQICTVIYKTVFPIIIKTSTALVLLGLVAMYFAGEKSLTPDKKKR